MRIQLECLGRFTKLIPGTVEATQYLQNKLKIKVGTTTGFTKVSFCPKMQWISAVSGLTSGRTSIRSLTRSDAGGPKFLLTPTIVVVWTLVVQFMLFSFNGRSKLQISKDIENKPLAFRVTFG